MTAFDHRLATAAESSAHVGAVFMPSMIAQDDARPRGLYRNIFKRCCDLFAILLTLPIVLPIIAVLAALVALDGGKPFYRQKRIGLDGRIYMMWKLRSMVCDADERLEAHLAANPTARLEWDSTQKLKCDPRITTIGQLLRKSSLDELPQLFNVFKGDMSLVGPRPMMISQQPLYPGTDYYDMRPGITGLWQVSERNASTFADRAGFDTQYSRSLSLISDTRILISTVAVVLRGTGY